MGWGGEEPAAPLKSRLCHLLTEHLSEPQVPQWWGPWRARAWPPVTSTCSAQHPPLSCRDSPKSSCGDPHSQADPTSGTHVTGTWDITASTLR